MKRLRALVWLLSAAACGTATQDPCREGGRATMGARVLGLHDEPVEVRLTGPATTALSCRADAMACFFENAPTGTYSVSVDPYAFVDGPRVRRAVAPSFPDPVCAGAVFDVTFTAIATSHHLWWSVSNGTNAGPVGFDDAVLAAPSTTAMPAFYGEAGAGSRFTFDRWGRLWATAGTSTDPDLMRFDSAVVAGRERRTPSLKFSIANQGCLPFAGTLALDAQENVWLSSPCKRQVLKFDRPGAVPTESTLTASTTLQGLDSAEGLAFDAAGNLWVADPDAVAVRRYDATSLGSASPMPALTLHAKSKDDPLDMGKLTPLHLAFDDTGALWGADFGANVLFRLAPSTLTGTGERTVTPSVRLGLAVDVILEGLAFDEEGSLWVPLSQNRFGRIPKAQLSVGTTSAAPTQPEVFLSPGLGSASWPVFFPPPSWSPLQGNLRNL